MSYLEETSRAWRLLSPSRRYRPTNKKKPGARPVLMFQQRSLRSAATIIWRGRETCFGEGTALMTRGPYCGG